MGSFKTRRLVFIALLIAQAIILNYVETILGFNLGIPGAKLGLANIITLIALFTLPFKDVVFVVFVRNMLVSAMFGSLYVFIYSICGGLLSLFAMYLLLKVSKKRISIFAVSISGAIAHNIGQLLVASFVISSLKIMVYLPFLVLIAIPTGLAIGIASKTLLKYLKRSNFIFIESGDIHE